MSNGDVRAAELLQRYAAGERVFDGVYLADGEVLYGANLEGATFDGGFFTDIDARDANLRGTTFRNTNLKCTDFRGSDLTNAKFENVLIEGAAFRGAIVDGASFSRMTHHGKVIEDFDPEDWG